MKTPKDFMPPRLTFYDKAAQKYFNDWYDIHIFSLFNNGVVMYCDHSPFDLDNDGCADMSPGEFTTARFCFFAISVQPLKQAVTKQELLDALGGRKTQAEMRYLAERIGRWGIK